MSIPEQPLAYNRGTRGKARVFTAQRAYMKQSTPSPAPASGALGTVQVEKLEKVYPGGTHALNGITITVGRGEFFGLLGPNGAGKSTTLKILSTLLKKTAGRVVINGHEAEHDPMSVRKSIGFAMQEVGLDDLSKGTDFLILQGELYGLSNSESKRRTDELLELVGLSESAVRKIGTYSGGMRRRLDLVSALIHNPPIIFLDEPTTGLDPQSRLAIWDYLEKLNSQGITIVLTTQMMDEADRLCRSLAIVDRGVIVAEGSPRSLKEGIGGDVATIHLEGADAAMTERAVAVVKTRAYVSTATHEDTVLTVTVTGGRSAVPDLLRTLQEQDILVSELAVASPSLDDVFLKHTGHKIRTGEAGGGDEMNMAMRQFMGLSKK